jgi:FMN phosphatase YigB (HAD superfamily)
MRKIIVDIDNTLWDLAPVLHQYLMEVNPAMPGPADWHQWDFWRGIVSEKDLYKVLREIHMEQDRFGVYPESGQFLARLKKEGFYIIIASHREKGTLDATVRWLEKHKLSFDEVHLSHDKTVLFPDCWAIVDDSPVTLDKAAEAGVVGVGLRNPWNEEKDHPLFSNLSEIFDYLQKQCSAARDVGM